MHDDTFKEQQKPMRPRSNSNLGERDITKETHPSATANRVIREAKGSQTSSIVPVWVSSITQPDQEVLVYALLDTQSDTTFILDEVAKELETVKENVSLRLSTMSAKVYCYTHSETHKSPSSRI